MYHSQTIKAESSVATPVGIAAGTRILTLAGARAVETLTCGDRIITRKGAASLRDLVTVPGGGYALCFDTPQVVLMADGQVHSDSGLPYAA